MCQQGSLLHVAHLHVVSVNCERDNNSEASKFDTAQRLDHSSEASKPETVEKLAQFGHKQV